MAESGESEDLVLEPVAQRPYGYVENESEGDEDLYDNGVHGAAVLTARNPDKPRSSREHARRKEKKALKQAERAELTGAAETKKVELTGKAEKKKVQLKSAAQLSGAAWQSDEWHYEKQSQWTHQWNSQPFSGSQPKQHKRSWNDPSSSDSRRKFHCPPPPPSLLSGKATATKKPFPDPVPTGQASNPFGTSVPSQPSQPSQPTLPANLPPGTVVCFLPK